MSATELGRDDAEPPSTGFNPTYESLLLKHLTVSVSVEDALTDCVVPPQNLMHRWIARSLAFAQPPTDAPVAYEVAIAVVDASTAQSLNAEYRGNNKPTNVLSFPSGMPMLPNENDEPALAVLGDIVLCHPVIVAEASTQLKTAEHHWAHMIVHSVLHLLGHDHVQDAAANTMEALEVDVLQSLSIPNPYHQPLQAS